MPFNASMSGSFSARGRFGSVKTLTDIFKPSGTSRVLGLSFNDGLTNLSPDTQTTISISGSSPTFNASGGVVRGFASGFSMPATGGSIDTGNSIFINSIPPMSNVNYTFIAWYKGTQTASHGNSSWSVGVPIFGDPRGTVYFGVGVDRGRAAIGEKYVVTGLKNVSDNNWHMIAWTFNSSNRVNVWIDGYRQIYDYKMGGSGTGIANSRIDYIGKGYPYAGNVSPSNLDGIQVYNQVLTESQIREIYREAIGSDAPSPFVSARYWRVRYGAVTVGGHHPRVSRIILRDTSLTTYNVATFTSDNLSDSGTIPTSGSVYSYDAGAGNTKSMIGAGYYVTYNAPSDPRGGVLYIDYSNDNSNWTEYNLCNIVTNHGGGLYFTDGQTPV